MKTYISDKGKTRLEFSVGYLNSEKTGVDASHPIAISTGENSFVTVPTRVGSVRTNTDALVVTTGVRYGIAKKTELYGRVSAITTDKRARDASGVNHQDKDSRLADAWVGLNH